MSKDTEHAFMLKCEALIITICFLYANLRYVVFGPEVVAHIPLYIMNKALSWSGLATIGLSKVFGQAETRRMAGLLGTVMIGMHVVMSLLILRPEYLGKFFNSLDGMRMTWEGEAAMLFGILGLVFLACLIWNTAITNKKSDQSSGMESVLPRPINILLFCVALHVAFMGWDDWFEPAKWAKYGYLPPITMLSFFTAVMFLFAENFLSPTTRSKTGEELKAKGK